VSASSKAYADLLSEIYSKKVKECPQCQGKDLQCGCNLAYQLITEIYKSHIPFRFRDAQLSQFTSENEEDARTNIRKYMDNLAQMREDIVTESREILDRLGPLLADLERTADPELIRSIFREVHTLKGTAGFVGLVSIQKLGHKMEDLFGALRDGSISITPDLIDVAFDGVRSLEWMQNDLASGGAGEADISALIKRLEFALGGEAATPAAAAVQENAPGKTATLTEFTLRVDIQILDQLMTLVGELITARNALQAISEQLKDEALLDTTAAIDRLTRQIQGVVTHMRLTPVERLFNRFIPVVRNIAREREKPARLVIEGGETPFDRSIFEQMYDPLIHLIRNAIDHGLEPAADRQQAGKPAEGILRLAAERRGEDVILRVSDDGRGMDPKNLRAVVVERGFMGAVEAANLSDEQALRLVFLPGLSTAREVTDTSGRGVGLDVVAQNVRSLRGSVDIETHLGQGTTFVIRLPLTMAVLQVMLVRAGEHIYALPLQVVRETLQLLPAEVHSMQQGKVVFIRGAALPLRQLGGMLDHKNQAQIELEGRTPAIVIHLTRGDEVVLVDELVGQQQVVIQPLSPELGHVQGVDGTAILPDGRVTLILDMEGLAHD